MANNKNMVASYVVATLSDMKSLLEHIKIPYVYDNTAFICKCNYFYYQKVVEANIYLGYTIFGLSVWGP